ncbi:MAG: hypothetical protein ACP5GI_00635 [Sulfolobales archaeon]
MIKISADICAKCKGHKKLCGLNTCPLLLRYRSLYLTKHGISSKELEGYTPPSGVIGEADYPIVALIYSIPIGAERNEAQRYDDPESWWGSLDLEDIITLRSRLISGVLRVNVREPEKLLEKEISLALISDKPVESDVYLKKIPTLKIKIDPFDTPRGLSAEAEKIEVVENPSVPKELDKIIWDEMKAPEATVHLYSRGMSIYRIQRAFSLGLLGKYDRRLVPTRWAITAVDTILSLYLLKKVRTYEYISQGEYYKISYLGNNFWIFLLPGPYSFNWIEIWHPKTIYMETSKDPVIIVNTEDWRGEAEYMDGGYQAARIAVLEHLEKIRRKASVLIVREITPKYYAPVGNWHIRESIRRAFTTKPTEIASLEEAYVYLSRDLSNDIMNEILRSQKELKLYKDLVNKKLDQYVKK